MSRLRRFLVRHTVIENRVVEAEDSEKAVAHVMDEYDLEFGQIVDVQEIVPVEP